LLEPLMRRHPARGLTLLESMVAVAIVALLTTLALPSFGGMLSRQRLKSAAEQMALDLSELRLQAAQRGHGMHLDVQAGPQWCYALAIATGCDCRVPQGCQLKTVTSRDHPGVNLVEAGALRVDPAPGASSGSVMLQSADGLRLRVTMTPLGRARICAPGPAVAGYPAC
jgi:type IV fimbrial biogenesis protein FimT